MRYSKVFRYDQLGRLVYESKSSEFKDELGRSESIVYLYDENGIIGMVYTLNGSSSTYYFQRNLLGDVIGIYDTNGTKVAGYTYDAWGNCTITVNTNGIATKNPIRYRGYYYDEDTKLYYLNARYYCPEWRRFISPAKVGALNPSSGNGLNLYSYANSNPISIAYNNAIVSGYHGGEVASSIRTNAGGKNPVYYSTVSNSSNVLGALGALSTAFGYFDQWSGFLSGGLDAGLGYWGPKGFGFQFLERGSNTLSKFGTGMAIAGSVLSWGSSVYNNFTNPNYTTGEALVASTMDAAYYAGKGYGTYLLGSQVGTLAVNAGIAAGSASIGATMFGTTVGFLGAFAIGGGVAVVVGIAGAVAIYYLGEGIDWLYGKVKEWVFE